jgi:hypothetical protein
MVQAYEQPDGSPSIVYEAPGHERSRADSAEEALLQALQPGEHTYLFTECLRRQKFQLFERAVVAVTDRRLIVIGPAFPWGNEVKADHALATCTVINGKERIDGSRLMVIRHDHGTLCLYFARSHRDEADAVLNTVGFQPAERSDSLQEIPDAAELDPPVPSAPAVPNLSVQQFSELVHSLDPVNQDEDEDSY